MGYLGEKEGWEGEGGSFAVNAGDLTPEKIGEKGLGSRWISCKGGSSN